MKVTKHGFVFDDFEITIREILASVSIIAVMMVIGIMISAKISIAQADANDRLDKAVKIEDNHDLFSYGMRTNVGDALVSGDLDVVDPVTYDEIGGQYIWVRKERQKYTMHTKRVKSGKHWRTVTYWTWDYQSAESKQCEEIKFCGEVFNSNKISGLPSHHIITLDAGYHLRDVYSGIDPHFNGAVYTVLSNKTISDNTEFYNAYSVEDLYSYLYSTGDVVIFWVFWIFIMMLLIAAFVYADNNWLK